jgi:peptide chain release factor
MSFVLLITAGTGPEEVRSFARALGKALRALLADRGNAVQWSAECAGSLELGLLGDPSSVADLVGTHVWVHAGRGRKARKRWYVAVSTHPTGEAASPLDPAEVVFRASRAGGPGGQHVNTTASAVRAVHGPSGFSVRVASERSQYANRRRALRLLAARLADLEAKRAALEREGRWRAHRSVVRGHPVCRWRSTPKGLRREDG